MACGSAGSVTARRALATLALGTLSLGALATATWALAQNLPTVTVERSDRTIVIAQRTAGVDGARTVLANRNCEDGVLTNVFYGPVAGWVETLFDETRLVSQIARVRVPQAQSAGRAEEDAPGDDTTEEQETIELWGGALTFDRPGCIEESRDEGVRPVELHQGRTLILGSRFFLDRGTDIAELDGPVSLERGAEDGSSLQVTADRSTFDVSTERATLSGNVVVTSQERVTTADELVLDEEAGVALLRGDPAVSRRGDDVVSGRLLRYDLETDDVVVSGNVSASFEVDLGD